jgi:hypothetical protein
MLILIAAPIFLYAWRGVQVAQTFTYKTADIDMVCQDLTPVDFWITVNFSAIGAFSAENPIHIQAVIFNVNVSDLLTHIAAITFTAAYNVSGTVFKNDLPYATYLPLSQADPDTYLAEGDLVWHESESVYLVALAPFSGGLLVPENAGVGPYPLIDISPVSDTLSFRANQRTEQLTDVLVAFSIIALQPIFSAILKELPPRKQNPPNRQKP